MLYPEFIREIIDGSLAIRTSGLYPLIPYIEKILAGAIIEPPKLEKLQMKLFDFGFNEFIDTGKPGETQKDAVAVIPIRGTLTKYGTWWDYGTEDYAALLKEAYKDDSIKAVILRVHSPGGSTHSVIPITAAISMRNKAVITAMDSELMSAAYYFALYSDKIIAVDEMAEVGSIGIMAQVVDDRKMMEGVGLKIIEIIPPESKWKNKPIIEARDGKPQLLIKEELSPWAVRFQNLVKEQRPNLDMQTEGIIEGRTFYANDALSNGLIDAIMPIEDIIKYAFDYTAKEVTQFLT